MFQGVCLAVLKVFCVFCEKDGALAYRSLSVLLTNQNIYGWFYLGKLKWPENQKTIVISIVT